MFDADDDERKKKYYRIHIQSLYERNDCPDKKRKEALKTALQDCKEENKRMTAYCDRLISALDDAANSDDFQSRIKNLIQKPHPTCRGKLAHFLQEKHPEISFDVEVPALEEWVQDSGKDKKSLEMSKTETVNIMTRLDEARDKLRLNDELTAKWNELADAYENDQFDKIKSLRESLPATAETAAMLFAFRDAVCYDDGTTRGNPRGKLPKNTFMTVNLQSEPSAVPEPIPDKILDGYTSDEWMQLLTGSGNNGALPSFLEMTQESLHLAEGLEISALREVLPNKFPQNFEKLTPEEKELKVRQLKAEMNPAETAKFNVAVIGKAEILAECLPPHQLVAMAQSIDKQLGNEASVSEEQKQQLNAQKMVLIKAMAAKTKGVALGDIIIDGTNIADVYDGAVEMFDYLQSLDVQLEGEGEFSFAELKNTARQKLDEAIDAYDHYNGLTDIKAEDAGKLEQAFDDAWAIAKEIDINDKKQNETWFSNIGTFFDSLSFTEPEADKKKQTFIETLKLEAARNAAVRAADKSKQELADELKAQLQAVAEQHIQTLIATDVIANLPENATDEQRRQAVAKALAQPEHKICDKGLAAYQAATVNSHISFLNRLAGPSHLNNRSAPVLNKMYGPLQKIDRSCIARFGKNYAVVRNFGRMTARNMGAQALNQAIRIGCNTVGLALGTPGLGSQIYAGVYAAQALVRLGKSFAQERRDAQAKGEKYNFGKFMLQKTPEILMTAATTASIFFGGEIARRGMEAVARYGIIGAGFAISLVKGIRSQRRSGEKWGKAVAKAFANSAASTGTAVLTGMGMAWGVNNLSSHIENNPSFDLWGEHGVGQPPADSYNAEDPSFTKTPVGAENLADYAQMPAEELNEAGIVKEPVSPETAAGLVGESDENLSEKGIVRSETDANDSNGVKVIDEPAQTTVKYTDNAVEKAQNILEMWTKDAPGLLEDNVAAAQSAVDSWNNANPGQAVDVHRVLLIAGDCGAQMVNAELDTNMHHVDGSDTPKEVNGNHKVFGQAWCEKNGFTADEIKAVAAITDADGKLIAENMTPEVMETIAKLDMVVSAHNQVGHVDGAPVHQDGVLPRNAAPNAAGEMEYAQGSEAEVYTTYANGEGKECVNTPEKAHHERFDRYSKIEQHSFIPFTVTFDRIYGGVQKMTASFNLIMGANGRYKETLKEDGSKEKPAAIKPITPDRSVRS